MNNFLRLLILMLSIETGQAQNIGFGTDMPTNALSVDGKVNITDSLGIGFTNPLRKLDILGDARINTLVVGLGAGAMLTNTALGYNVLNSNQTGDNNTALGYNAFQTNQTGAGNTSLGHSAMSLNTSGNQNTAIGSGALTSNTTGASNTAFGYGANVGSANLTNATAVGANASVTASNSLVLGSGANVGIGTAAPTTKLDVNGKVKTTEFQMATGAAAGLVLKSDASGNGTWANVATLETDPQIGAVTTSRVPRWSGTQLLDGSLFDNNTYVGLGTTTPNTRLDIVAPNNGIRVLSNNTSLETSIQLGRTSKEGLWGVAGGADDFATGTVSGDIVIRTESASKRLIFANGGNAAIVLKNSRTGINAFDPMSKLSVKGEAAIGAGFGGNVNAPANSLAIEGTVGIGTNAPNTAGKLHVVTPLAKTSNTLDTVAFLGTNDAVPFGLQLSLKGGASLADRTARMQTAEGSSVGGRLILQHQGASVGIGTANPITTLDVNGGIRNRYGGVETVTDDAFAGGGETLVSISGTGIPSDWNKENTVIVISCMDPTVRAWGIRDVGLSNGTVSFLLDWYIPNTAGSGTYVIDYAWMAIRIHN